MSITISSYCVYTKDQYTEIVEPSN